MLLKNGKILNTTSLFNLHGNSLFTTMLISNGYVQHWKFHWARLTYYANYFEYALPNEELILTHIKNGTCTKTPWQKVRIILAPKDYFITIDDYSPPPWKIYSGVKVILSSYHVHKELKFFKTTSYMPYHLALKEARNNLAFEALMRDEKNYIVDGSRSSLMLFTGEEMIFLKGGIKGVMRKAISKWLKENEVNIRHSFLKYDDLKKGQLILTNSLMGAVPVGNVKDGIIKRMVENFCPLNAKKISYCNLKQDNFH